jgi:pimeloyl-ACP methyl ester carboxylesterase
MIDLPRRIRPIAAALTAGALLSGCVSLATGDIPYASLRAKYAAPGSRFIDMPGGLKVRYRDEGPREAPALVLVHGFSASLDAWQAWEARLSPDYRVISLDLPGHGLTEAPGAYAPSIDAYADLVDDLAGRLGVTSYVVAGNSMGGATAWDDALRHADHVRALVLVDAAGWPGDRRAGGPPLAAGLMRSGVGRAMLRHVDTRPMATSGLKSAYVDQSLVTPALVDRYVDFSRAPGHRDMLLRIRSRPATPITAATFAAIAKPTLVLHGEADALIPLADGKAFAAAIPGARLITYPGVGHVPMEQIPDRSAADLRDFLKSLP